MSQDCEVSKVREIVRDVLIKQKVDSIENVSKGLLAIGLVLCLLIFSNYLSGIQGVGKYISLFLNGVLIAILLNTLGTLVHEAQHNILTNTRSWNEFWGRVFSAFLIFPYYTGKVFHLEHHRYEREKDKDPENLFHDQSFWRAFFTGHNEYTRLHWQRMLHYLLHAKNKKDQWGAAVDLIWNLGGVVFFLIFFVTLKMSFWVAFLPAFIAGPLVFSFRYMTDHYGMDEKPKSVRESYQRPISRVIFTAPILEWLWSHINYHQVHHHFPQISHNNLPEVYARTKELVHYEVEPGYLAVLKKIHGSRYYKPEGTQRSIS